jgi:hypothetical protein
MATDGMALAVNQKWQTDQHTDHELALESVLSQRTGSNFDYLDACSSLQCAR